MLNYSLIDLDYVCDKPRLSNGSVILESKRYHIGAIAQYKCNIGYFILGSSSRQCLLSGEWSGFQPFCIRKHCFAMILIFSNSNMYTRGFTCTNVLSNIEF